MLIALISDLHGNEAATRSVLRKIDEIKPDRVLVLGDLVGYGPRPVETIAMIMDRGYDCILGNHDGAITGDTPLSLFREPNRNLLEKTKELLPQDQKDWLGNMPVSIAEDNWLAVHASPINPLRWEYLDSAIKCMQALETIEQEFCFVGHTHRPGVVSNQFGILNVQPGYRYVVNPGSVGQPRDGDERASFCTIDTEKYSYKNYRISYTITETLDAFQSLKIDRKTGKRLMGFI